MDLVSTIKCILKATFSFEKYCSYYNELREPFLTDKLYGGGCFIIKHPPPFFFINPLFKRK